MSKQLPLGLKWLTNTNAELIWYPIWVQVVERYANHEQAVFSEVAEARARVGSVQLTPEALNDPKPCSNIKTLKVR